MSLGIYVHIPFCKAKCLYCDFNSYANMEMYESAYIHRLCDEILSSKHTGEVDTLYIGGGTPTVLPSGFLAQIIAAVRKKFEVTSDCEITVECNPATMREEGFRELLQAGVNRLSIGLQSANNRELKRLGRIHNFEEFSQCFYDARRAGFENISVDLMYGLPGQDMGNWEETLKAAVKFHPEHLSCYALKLEEGTPLFAQKPELPDDDTVAEFYDLCVDYLAKAGYERYEISNFSLNGKESRHNYKYWKCENFLGFGAGAYSCMNGERFCNVRDIQEYCNLIRKGKSVVLETTPLSREDKMKEFCFLGLRMVRGISSKEFYQRFGESIEDVFKDSLKKNLRRGTLLRLDDRIAIPPNFLYVSNSILIDFIEI